MTATSPRILRAASLGSFLLLAFLPVPAAAQLSDWKAQPVVNPSVVKMQHAVQYTIDGNNLYVFSGLTREWSKLQGFFGPPTVVIQNEHVVAQDGPIFYGFSTRGAHFAPLFPLSGTATLVTPSGGQLWETVVVDGNDVHMFSAYSGEWHSAHFDSLPTVQVKNSVVMIEAGSRIYAMSPLYGTVVPLDVTGATIVGGFGGCGIALSPGFVHGYSAHLNRWTSLAVAAPPTVTNGFSGQPAFVALQDGVKISFYSGQTGTFTTLPAPPSSAVNLHRSCAIVQNGSTVYGYSAMRGEYQTLALPSAPTSITVSHFFALVGTATDMYGYSADSNQFSAPYPGSSFSVSLGQTAAFIDPFTASPGASYSALTNQWVAAPIKGVVVNESNATILINPAGGVWGIAPRSTTWEFQSTGPISVTFQNGATPQGPGMLFIQDGNLLHVFNSRYGHWRAVEIAGPIQQFKGHWGAAVAVDGVNAYSYGVFNDRWSTVPLSGPVNQLGADVEATQVWAGNEVIGYSAYGQLLTSADYPEYWRGVAIGGRFRLDLAGEPGKSAFFFLGLPGEFQTPMGTLGVNPSTMSIFALPTIGFDGRYYMTLTVPQLPELVGAVFNIQAAIQGIFIPYLTNPIEVRLL